MSFDLEAFKKTLPRAVRGPDPVDPAAPARRAAEGRQGFDLEAFKSTLPRDPRTPVPPPDEPGGINIGGVEIPGRQGRLVRGLGRLALETGAEAGALAVTKNPVPGAARIVNAGRRLVQAGASGAAGGAASLLSEGFDPTEDPEGTAKLIAGTSAVTDLVFGTVGDAFAKRFAARKIRNAARVEPGAREAQARFRELGSQGLTAGRVSTRQSVDIAETITEKSLTAGGPIREQLEEATRVGQQELDDLVAPLLAGRNRTEVGQVVIDAFEEGVSIFKETGRQLYDEVDQLAGGVQVTFDSVLDLRRQITARGRADKASVKKVLTAFDESLADALGIPDAHVKELLEKGTIGGARVRSLRMPFSKAQQLRTEMLRFGQSSDPIARDGAAQGRRFTEEITGAILSSGTRLQEPGAVEAFEAANAFWARGREVLEDRSIAALTRADPDTVLQVVFQPGRTERLKRLKRATFGALGEEAGPVDAKRILQRAERVLADPDSSADARVLASRRKQLATEGLDTWNALAGQVLLDEAKRSGATQGLREGAEQARLRGLGGEKIQNRLGRLEPEQFNELFPDPAVRKRLRVATDMIRLAQAPAGRNIPGAILVQLNTGAAVGQVIGPLISFGLLGPGPEGFTVAGAIIMGPMVLGRLVSRSAKFTDNLLKAVNPRNALRVRQRAFAQMAQLAALEGAVIQNAKGETISQSTDRPVPPPAGLREQEQFRARSTRGLGPQ